MRAYAPNFSAVTWKGHFAIVAAVTIVIAAIPILMINDAQRASLADLFELGESISNETGIKHTKVKLTSSRDSSQDESQDSKPKTVVTVTMKLASDDVDKNVLANRVAKFVMDHYPKSAAQADQIEIEMVHGADIGIATMETTYTSHAHSPSEWQERILKANEVQGTSAADTSF